jgi:hypothetical protein
VDEIAFELAPYEYGGGRPTLGIAPVINGRALSELCRQNVDTDVPVAAEDVLADDAALWRSEPTSAAWLVEGDRVAVLTCDCGEFGCSGVAARIVFGANDVTWCDFHAANLGPALQVGPFTFSRDQYESALSEAAEIFRSRRRSNE